MSTSANEWFVSRGGQRFGPVTFEQVIDAAKGGRLEPRTDLLIGGGLGDWTPAGEVDGVFEKKSPEELAADAAKSHAAGNSMAAAGQHETVQAPTRLELPGAPRLGFILGIAVLPTLVSIGLIKLIPELQALIGPEYGQYAAFLLMLVPILVIVITVKRFQNIGMSGWWTLGLWAPILNLWLQYRLIACPPGYAYTKKLDVMGWILAVLYWLSLIGSVVVMGLFGAEMIKEFVAEGHLQAWENKFEVLRAKPSE